MEKLHIKIEPSTGEYGSVVSINGIDLIVSSQEDILEEVLSFLGYEVEIERLEDTLSSSITFTPITEKSYDSSLRHFLEMDEAACGFPHMDTGRWKEIKIALGLDAEDRT